MRWSLRGALPVLALVIASPSLAHAATVIEAPSGLTTNPASPAVNPAPAISGSAPAGSYVLLYASGDCSPQTHLASGTAADFVSTGLGGGIPRRDVAASRTVGTRTTQAVGAGAAQLFTAGLSGSLTRVGFNPAKVGRAPASGALTIELRTVAAGVPTATVLASMTLTSANITDWGGNRASYAFPTPAAVQAGTQYAIVFSATSASWLLYSDGGQLMAPAAGGWSTATGETALEPYVLTTNDSLQYSARTTFNGYDLSECSTPVDYVSDNTAPDPPTTLAFTQPRSGALTGIAEPQSTIRLHATQDCSGPVVASGTAESFAAPGFAIDSVSTDAFSATATDAAGNRSGCSAAARVPAPAIEPTPTTPTAPTTLTTPTTTPVPASTPAAVPSIAPAPAPTTTRCQGPGVVLAPLVRRPKSLSFSGVTEPAKAGATVELLAGGRVVAKAVVGPDGAFGGRAPGVSSATSRYVAVVGSYRSSPVTPTPQVTARVRRTSGDGLRVTGRVRTSDRRALTATLIGRADACAARMLERDVAVRADGSYAIEVPAAAPGLYRVVVRRGLTAIMSSPFQRIEGAPVTR